MRGLPRAGEEKGGLDLTRRASALTGGETGAAIVPGQPEDSLLIDKVAEGEMPPNGPLSKEQVAVVRAWIESGASYPSEPLTPRRGGRLVVAPTGPPSRTSRRAGKWFGLGPHSH